MKSTIRILYTENDHSWQNIVKEILGRDFEIKTVNCGKKAWRLFQNHPFDLLLTNLQTPGLNGIELTQLVRSVNNSIPIIILSSIQTIKDEIIKGLAVGADDFIFKDIPPQEFIARLEATLRRCKEYNQKLKTDNLFQLSENTALNSTTKTLTTGEVITHLTSIETKLLKILALHLNQCVTKEHLTEELWKSNGFEKNAYLDKYLVRIRKYLKKDLSVGIINIRGEGFCLSNQL